MSIQILSNLNYPIGNIINQELQNANSAKIAKALNVSLGELVNK